MATFSENQVRQLYVVLDKATGFNATTTAGSLKVESEGGDLFFNYQTPNGDEVVRTDLIPLNKINSIKAVKGVERPLTLKQITLNSDVNGGNPVVGQEYILRMTFTNYGVGGVDNTYIKEVGAYRVRTGDTVEKIFIELKKLADANFSREPEALVNISLGGTQASKVMSSNSGVTVKAVEPGVAGNKYKFAVQSVSASEAKLETETDSSGNITFKASLTGAAKTIADLKALVEANTNLIFIEGTDATTVSAETTAVTLEGGEVTGLLVEEALRPYIRGRRQGAPIRFIVQSTMIDAGSGFPEALWATVEDITSTNTNKQQNGRVVADMEWFYIGERADQFREAAYPNNFDTVYLANPSKSYGFVEISYYYSGVAEDVQKSPKQLTLAIPTDGNYSISTLISDIETATGLTVDDQTGE